MTPRVIRPTRRVLLVPACTAALALAAGCGGPASPPDATEASAVVDAQEPPPDALDAGATDAEPSRDAEDARASDAGIDGAQDGASDARVDGASDAGADAPPRPVVEAVVRAGSVWRYRDDGRDLGAAWREPGYDDAAWRQGPAQLGYGDGDEATRIGFGPDPNAKYITTYFRRAFAVSAARGVRRLTLRLLRDDGAVVYLNGREVHRSNMLPGAVTFATRAATSANDAEETAFRDVPIDPAALVEGTNVVAVELHQVSPTSTDVSFDLELVTDRADTPLDLDPVLVGAGDIALCGGDRDEATAALLDGMPGTVFLLGDNVYNDGSEAEYRDCFGPTWGRHRARTRPSVGNHEYQSPAAAPYYRYFGAAAGAPTEGWYSYDVGAWHVVVLNSNCASIGGCGAGSRQERWLRADLAAHPTRCTLAYWHHPRFSSGPHGNATGMRALWQALQDAGADLVLSGHDHDYERFAPKTADGAVDAARGIRSFVVGTGGAAFRPFATVEAGSEVRNADSHGVLRLVLRATSYEWRFVPVAGRTFSDSGRADCR